MPWLLGILLSWHGNGQGRSVTARERCVGLSRCVHVGCSGLLVADAVCEVLDVSA